MSSSSQPPPSAIPGHSSGGGLYLVGAVILVGGAVGLIVWKRSHASAPPALPAVVASAGSQEDAPPLRFAPPPPPTLDDEPDAGVVDAGVAAPKSTGAPAGGHLLCGTNCSGTATSSLTTALRAKAQSAQGCYQRALRTAEVSGSLMVSVQVSPSGSVCSASLTKDSVRSAEISSCVLGRFRGQTFPPPSGGCVTVNIPISFTIKQ